MHRREFLATSTGCGAYLALLLTGAPKTAWARCWNRQEPDSIVTREKWGSLQQLDEDLWVHVATPFTTRDYTTVCNSGIIAGTDRVLVVDAFMQPSGAKWLSEWAEKLTGRRPTDVVCTHYHADHTAGHAGFEANGVRPQIWMTRMTNEAAAKSLTASDGDPEFKNLQTIPADRDTELDLGGRTVRLRPRSGHTSSDITIELVEPRVVWSGDLFFNRIFPNYLDAIPSRLNEYADAMRASEDAIFVPGHGPVADADAVRQYREFLGFMQQAAEKAKEAGQTPEQASAEFQLPASLEQWLVWSPAVVERGFQAWFREWNMEG